MAKFTYLLTSFSSHSRFPWCEYVSFPLRSFSRKKPSKLFNPADSFDEASKIIKIISRERKKEVRNLDEMNRATI